MDKPHDCEHFLEEARGCSICSTLVTHTLDEAKGLQEHVNARVVELRDENERLANRCAELQRRRPDAISKQSEVAEGAIAKLRQNAEAIKTAADNLSAIIAGEPVNRTNRYADVHRIIEWINKGCAPANTAFTEGPERELAYHIERLLTRREL